MFKDDAKILDSFESVDSALDKFINKLGSKNVGFEEVNVEDSLNRILFDDLVAQYDLPSYNKSLIDGFALNSSDISFSDSENPTVLEVIGENGIQEINVFCIGKNQAVRICTGAALPENADVVVPYEYTESNNDTLRVFKSIISGGNIVKKGDDIASGEFFILKNRKIRPQDIGGILSIGYRKINVYKKPVISVIPTGSELINIDEAPKPGQVVSSNVYVLKGVIQQLGAEASVLDIVKDDIESLCRSIEKALNSSDMIIISGGSGNGIKDYTLKAIMSFENSKVLSHGIAMRPGRMTILGFINNKPVVGLPGHPVSSLTSFLVFAKPAIVQLCGNPRSFWQERKEQVKLNATLARDVESPKGRVDFIRVRLMLTDTSTKISAYPYAGKSSYISTLAKAHGFIKLPVDCSKLYAGDNVEVLLF